MRIIIGGAGRVGIALAKSLANDKYDIVVIDNDSRAVATAQGLDCLVIHGSITSREKLLEAGIANAEVFVAATPSDEANLIACAIAEHAYVEEGGKSVLKSICRLRDSTYIEEFRNGHLTKWANVDHVVNPLRGAIGRLNAGLRSTDLEEVVNFEDDAYVLEFDVAKTARNLVGRPLGEVKEDFVHGLPNIVGVKREGQKSLFRTMRAYLRSGTGSPWLLLDLISSIQPSSPLGMR